VGVAPGDTVQLQNHYGSLCTMADYTSSVMSLYASASFVPIDRLMLLGNIMYTRSRAGMDKVLMPVISEEVESSLEHQDFTFEDMDEYSNILYGLVQAGVGLKYRLAPKFTITADAEYADLNDETGYVYGIESGSYFMIRTGAQIEF
jgi:hypothetical protein